jgi:hypothetical protein
MITVETTGIPGLIVCHLSGFLSAEDYEPVKRHLERAAENGGIVSVILVLDGFDGWRPDGVWTRLKLTYQYGSLIHRVAVVGPPEDVQSVAYVTSSTMPDVPVEAFGPNSRAAAEQWAVEGLAGLRA